jgi:predicted nucleotidyltransferase
MQSAFTTFASSRFVDIDAVISALKDCALRIKASRQGVEAVYLFGSFATGKACPRSDADIVIVISDSRDRLRSMIFEEAMTLFFEAPVTVELFVLSEAQLSEGRRSNRGVAGAVAREGILLA